MGRWEPGARERLVMAAVDLFTEQGYDATTVAQIAERAGVTKSTFFRHFPDKRELLVAGQETLSRLLAEGIAEAPGNASPLEAVAAGLARASTAMGPVSRELGRA
jgi:AcrR family transcriptional regulator